MYIPKTTSIKVINVKKAKTPHIFEVFDLNFNQNWDDIEKHVLATLNMSEDDYIDLQEEVIDFLNC